MPEKWKSYEEGVSPIKHY